MRNSECPAGAPARPVAARRSTEPLALLPPISYALGQRVHRRYETVQAAFSAVSDRVQENIAGIRVVKGFAREADQIARFEAVITDYQRAIAHLARIDDLHAFRVGNPEQRHVAIIFNDISKRRRDETALRQSTERLRRHGLAEVTWRPLTFGIATLYVGKKV